jgi:hypothetical protein
VPGVLEQPPASRNASAARCRQQEQHRSRIQQQRDHQDEPAQYVLIVGAEQGRQISHWTEIGLDLCPFPIGRGLLELEGGKCLAGRKAWAEHSGARRM